MAITINQQPATYSPVYNPLIFVVTSDNTGEPNFQYVFDIYWGSVLQTRHRLPARPVDGKAVFDAMRMIEAQVTHDINKDTLNTIEKNLNSYLKFQVKIGEEYDVAGVLTLTADLATSNNIYAFNGVFDYLDFINYSSADYLLASSSSKFLTNAPLIQKVATGDLLWLHSMAATTANYSNLVIKRYNSAGGLIGTTNISNSYTAATDDNQFLRAGIGPQNLLDGISSSFLDGVSYYTVQIVNGAAAAVSEIRRFNLDSECSKYEPVRLHWLNKPGGFDAKSFNLVSKEEASIERKTYKRLTGTLTGGSFSYADSDRSEHVLNTVVNDSLIINSDWLSEEESLWLKELVSSPLVFQQIGTDLIPVTVKESRYQPQKKVNNKLFNLSLSVSYTTSNYRQRY